MTALTELSDQLAAAAESVAASIVSVRARRRLPSSGIAWAPNIIVTANHTVERDDDIAVVLPSGDEVPATLAGRDPGSDIAVLKVEASNLAPANRAPAGSLKVGHLVLAMGRPGSGHQASLGVVGAIGGPWRTFRGATVQSYVRTDTTMFPGFSGGPLVDAAGRVAGMNSSMLGRGGGLTIPVESLEPVVESILAAGKVRRGYLGISTQPVAIPSAFERVAAGQESGLLIVGVEASSPAAAGGLLVGDILLAFAGFATTSADVLQEQLGPDRVGAAVEIAVIRGGVPATLSITVGERE